MKRAFRTTEHVRVCAANLCESLAPAIGSMPSDEADTLLERIVSDVSAQSGRTVSRLYVGSYFCDRYFCKLGAEGISRIAAYARARDLALTLVVPIFGQQKLGRGERIVTRCVHELAGENGVLDEVCVNDYGAASLVNKLRHDGAEIRVIWGRLFAKALRDPRYGAFSRTPQDVPYDRAKAERLIKDFGVALLELDPFAPTVSLRPLGGVLPVALHLPHSYLTTGHICEFATLLRPISHKFRADCPCSFACLRTLSVYETQNDEGGQLFFSKQGRTVYFENPNCALDNVSAVERVIWTPDDFGCPHELEWPQLGSSWHEDGGEGGWQWA